MMEAEIAEPVDPKTSHDAWMARKNAWKNDLHTASCIWELSREGVVFLKEYDDCDCLDKGEYHPKYHLHTIDEWPGMFTIDDDGHWVSSEPFDPFVLRAVPETLSHQSLPTDVEYRIEPGMKVVWEHNVRGNRITGGTEHEEAMIVGRILSTGEAEISKVYPDGSKFDGHDSRLAAVAHHK